MNQFLEQCLVEIAASMSCSVEYLPVSHLLGYLHTCNIIHRLGSGEAEAQMHNAHISLPLLEVS